MSNTAIKVENLSKAYRIGLKEARVDTLGGALASWARAPFKNYKKLRSLSQIDLKNDAPDIFWALRDLNFEVGHGEVLGIIGKNGAGKSTLLKILSRITEPTTGHIDIHGRVASLLEVGTGFNPELTGRENVYLNGTILGMTRREIDRKFEEIVNFSGVEKFLDTPVKRYSSGMKVRLAFAVAAHIDPEILIIDEVLAVGDIEFQKKCLGKMQDVSQREGRTVLFVSHDMGAITTLCPRSILLENGRIKKSGASSLIIQEYRSNKMNVVKKAGVDIEVQALHKETLVFQTDEKIELLVNIHTEQPLEGVMFYFLIKEDNSKTLIHYRLDNVTIQQKNTFQIEIAPLNLLPNRYDIEIKLILPKALGNDRITADFDLILTGEVSNFMNLGLLNPQVLCQRTTPV